MILPIKKFPDQVLRRVTEVVSFPLSKDLLKLTRDMIETVKHADGVGLAAPQVGRGLKLIVINLEKNGVPAFPLYNARVAAKAGGKIALEEGCLSIPGVYGVVKRPKKVRISAQNGNGEKIEIVDEGWISRVAQHEIDHTNGVLILDLIKKYSQGEEQVKQWKKQKLL